MNSGDGKGYFMSYKTEFQSNNTDLRAILNTVKAFPDPCSEEHASELADELAAQDDLIARIMETLTTKGYST